MWHAATYDHFAWEHLTAEKIVPIPVVAARATATCCHRSRGSQAANADQPGSPVLHYLLPVPPP